MSIGIFRSPIVKLDGVLSGFGNVFHDDSRSPSKAGRAFVSALDTIPLGKFTPTRGRHVHNNILGHDLTPHFFSTPR
jgi:hypothetical protein